MFSIPQHPPERPAIHVVVQRDDQPPHGLWLAGVRQKFARDILWNQPVFKAPALPIPNVALEPLPLRATRITRRPSASA
jgi:hypothetical protein